MLESYSSKHDSWLGWFLKGLLILGTLILLGRLIELQVVKGNYYRGLSEGNRIREVTIQAPRGKILARGGETLVGNKEVKKEVVFSPESGYTKKDVDTVSASADLISEWKRNYLLGQSLAHVGGYVGYVNTGEVGRVDPGCTYKGPLRADSVVGRGGLEEWYNCLLSGRDGQELIEVDTSGKKVRLWGKEDPIPGQDIRTNIDKGLQEKVAEVMKDVTGAVVVTDTKGEVLSLFSSPSFDPNIFVDKGNEEEISEVLTSAQTPLYNRVISGLYHPGSVFKQVVAIAALEEGTIDKDYLFNDTGQIVIENIYGTYTYNNWYFTQNGGQEGEIGVTRAITRSTDTFFYKVGELLGIEKLSSWAKKYGLGGVSGIDLPGEAPGLVPDPEWKEKTKNEQWFLGNTYHMSIGQGDLAITPLLVNTITAVTASGGKLCTPRLVGDGECKDLKIKKENIDLVKEGMGGACSSGGTGYTFFDADPKVGCKTGTAETMEKDITHAWFTFFAPLDDPEIVVTVFVEKGGEGSKVAGPIARQIYNFWFKK